MSPCKAFCPLPLPWPVLLGPHSRTSVSSAHLTEAATEAPEVMGFTQGHTHEGSAEDGALFLTSSIHLPTAYLMPQLKITVASVLSYIKER